MKVININCEQIVVENDITDEEIEKLIEEKGGFKLSKNNFSISKNMEKEIKSRILTSGF